MTALGGSSAEAERIIGNLAAALRYVQEDTNTSAGIGFGRELRF